nr:MAG TPA: hypothetical protein [Caudoviricetes sp.]
MIQTQFIKSASISLAKKCRTTYLRCIPLCIYDSRRRIFMNSSRG